MQCYFPYPDSSRYQRHPALVLATTHDSNGKLYLVIAGGTSAQKEPLDHKSIAAHELLVSRSDRSFPSTGLERSTKFQLNFENTIILPYNSDYFVVGAGKTTPVIGNLNHSNDARIKERLKAVAAHVNVGENISKRLDEISR